MATWEGTTMTDDFDAARLKVLSFDVFGTLISVRESSYGAFQRILRMAGATGIDVKASGRLGKIATSRAIGAPTAPTKRFAVTASWPPLRLLGSKGEPR